MSLASSPSPERQPLISFASLIQAKLNVIIRSHNGTKMGAARKYGVPLCTFKRWQRGLVGRHALARIDRIYGVAFERLEMKRRAAERQQASRKAKQAALDAQIEAACDLREQQEQRQLANAMHT